MQAQAILHACMHEHCIALLGCQSPWNCVRGGGLPRVAAHPYGTRLPRETRIQAELGTKAVGDR